MGLRVGFRVLGLDLGVYGRKAEGVRGGLLSVWGLGGAGSP